MEYCDGGDLYQFIKEKNKKGFNERRFNLGIIYKNDSRSIINS